METVLCSADIAAWPGKGEGSRCYAPGRNRAPAVSNNKEQGGRKEADASGSREGRDRGCREWEGKDTGWGELVEGGRKAAGG